MIGINIDVTERKRAEEELRQNRNMLAQILNSVPQSVFWKDRRSVYLGCNEVFAQAVGIANPEQIIGKTDADLPWPRHEAGAYRVDDTEVMESNRPKRHIVEPFQRADGTRLWVDTTKVPLCDGEGRVYGVLGVCEDITDRKRADEALRHSEERFRTIFEQAPLGIALVDSLTGRFLQCNPMHAETLGRTPEEMLALDFMSVTHPDDLQEDLVHMERLRSGEIRSFKLEKHCLHANGSVLWINLTVVAMWPEGEEPTCHIAMVEDITERKRADEALVKATAVAESANQAKDQFLAVLSHELRTPLMPVLATVAAMESEEGLPPEAHYKVAIIRRNVEMEARLIDDLLDVTRISRGKIELHREVVDVHACLHATLEICQAEIEAKWLEVSMELSASIYGAWADPTRLRQVFWNLLNNSAKFAPPHGRIIVRTSNDGERLKIEVADNGIGIDPEVLPRIFGAFDQGDRSRGRQFGGLGLGLSIAKSIVEMHGGRLQAFSEGLNKGAVFTVDLAATPFVPVPEAPAQTSASGAEPERRILLVDDHVDTLRTMTAILRKWGYTVETADSVHSALELAAQKRFDILVSDLGLPDGSGLEIMKEVKHRYGIHGCALSGYGMDEDIQESHAAGFEAHLTKPVSFQDLRTVLHRLASEAA